MSSKESAVNMLSYSPEQFLCPTTHLWRCTTSLLHPSVGESNPKRSQPSSVMGGFWGCRVGFSPPVLCFLRSLFETQDWKTKTSFSGTKLIDSISAEVFTRGFFMVFLFLFFIYLTLAQHQGREYQGFLHSSRFLPSLCPKLAS